MTTSYDLNSDDTSLWDDCIMPFQLDALSLRGRIVRLTTSVEEMLAQHDYPPAVRALLTEAALLTAMIGQTIKLRWKLSLQIRGSGPIRLIATDYFAPKAEGEAARIRAYASFDAEARKAGQLDDPKSGFAQLQAGMFAIMIDQGNHTQPYQGISPLEGESLAQSARHYFAQSEQLPTRFDLAMALDMTDRPHHWRAAGMMLQQLPPASGAEPVSEKAAKEARDEAWRRANALADTIEETELLGPHVTAPQLIIRLFHEDEPRDYPPQPIRFGCSCSEEKVRQSLSIYSAKDLEKMTTEQGEITADCQFCGAHYVLDPRSVGFEAADAEAGRGHDG